MPYNMTSFSGSNNILEMTVAVNNASNNLLIHGIMVTTYIILLIMLLRRNPGPESFAAASTVLMIAALIFATTGLISVIWAVGYGIIWGASLVGLYASK